MIGHQPISGYAQARKDVPRVVESCPPVADLAVWRERASWMAAAEHLAGCGLPAALPAELVPLARRRGLRVWERAA
jgi:hypothetical protein